MTKMVGFEEILQEEIATRKLVPSDVLHCIYGAYHTYSEIAHGNSGHLVLRCGDHSPNQMAALVVVLRMQSMWGDPITWTEVPFADPVSV